MIETSEKYKEFVYSQVYARHFLPEIVLKVIDAAAREGSHYEAADQAFMSNLSQLKDENQTGDFRYGTLADFQFLLGGSKLVLPDNNITGQFGFCCESMSDENGNFAEPVALTCTYLSKLTAVGRTLVFDTNYDAVPKDIDIEYYATGVLVHTTQIRDNTSHIVTTGDGVENFDKVIIKFLSTSIPYRRIHLPEDIPGIYFTYGADEVVSVNVNQSINIFNKDITVGEVVFQVENSKKTLDILNPTGFEQYLRQYQQVEINFNMVFPDDSIEKVPIGSLTLTEWKSQKGALTAQFTARDSLDKLTIDEYIKGTFPAGPISLYEYAEAVIKDAGFTDYKIDTQFLNIYTTAPLPIGTHKELLRLIAQAGQGIVLPTTAGGLRLKYISPLVVANNQLLNPCFDNDFTNWTHTGFTLDAAYLYTGKQAVKSNTGSLSQTFTSYAGHKLFIRFYAYTVEAVTEGSLVAKLNEQQLGADLRDANLRTEYWNAVATIAEAQAGTNTFALVCDGMQLYLDAFQILDLTTIYGAGKEPDIDWCLKNIRFFTSMLSIPKVSGPAPVTYLDYEILEDTPEITTIKPVKAVETYIYDYTTDEETSEIYKGQRYVSGTETFSIKFNKPAKECKITLKSVDAGAAEPKLVKSTLYAQAAEMTVTAVGNIEILVEGKEVTVESSTLRIDSSIDPSLVPDSQVETIDNKLITNKTVAEDVIAFNSYWYNSRYTYNFDWRQNPAIELYDPVQVHDDFDRNNTILITERNIDYLDGTLSGSSKGVC